MLEQDYLKKPVVKLLADMVSIPSVTGNEKEVAAFLGSYMSGHGLKVNYHKYNVHVTIGSSKSDAKILLFDSHIDTVKATDAWTIPAFQPTITNGRLYGLGSNDAGGCAAGMIEALIAANNSNLPDALAENNLAITYVASAEEETAGFNGFRDVISVLPGEIEYAFIGEPTGFKIGISQRGREVIDVTTHGKSGHASRPYEGINALDKMGYEFYGILEWYKSTCSGSSAELTLEATMAQAGVQTNQLPDKATITFDSRTTNKYPGEWLMGKLQANKKYPDTEINSREQNSVPAKSTSTSSPLIIATMRVLLANGLDPQEGPFGGASNWSFSPGEGMVFGPGESKESHQANESVDLSQVLMAPTIYLGLMQSYPMFSRIGDNP